MTLSKRLTVDFVVMIMRVYYMLRSPACSPWPPCSMPAVAITFSMTPTGMHIDAGLYALGQHQALACLHAELQPGEGLVTSLFDMYLTRNKPWTRP